jgi:hypothetical protein
MFHCIVFEGLCLRGTRWCFILSIFDFVRIGHFGTTDPNIGIIDSF